MRGSVSTHGSAAACVLFVVGLLGCYSARSAGVDDTSAVDDDQASEEKSEPVGAAGSAAAPGEPAMPEPAAHEVPLNAEQAACLGVDSPACAGCHGFHGKGVIVLRPEGLPPHPSSGQNGKLLMRCGVTD